MTHEEELQQYLATFLPHLDQKRMETVIAAKLPGNGFTITCLAFSHPREMLSMLAGLIRNMELAFRKEGSQADPVADWLATTADYIEMQMGLTTSGPSTEMRQQ